MSSGKEKGMSHWLLQRLTAIALVPLGLWFMISFVMLLSAPYEQAHAWLHAPWPMSMAILFLFVLFYHGALGLQVVLEDYVERPSSLILLTNCLSLILTLLGLASILKVYFS